MVCERYKEALTDAALGALDPQREAGLVAHLAGCALCRGALEDERRLSVAIDRGVAASLAAEPSPGFAVGVRRRLEDEPRPVRPWLSDWIPIAVGALAALALVTVWIAWRQPASLGTTQSAQTAPSQQPAASEGNTAAEQSEISQATRPGTRKRGGRRGR